MPRRARITVVSMPHHVVQRGHNRQATFLADEDYFAYRHSLREHNSTAAPYAPMCMTNHVYLLVTPVNDGIRRNFQTPASACRRLGVLNDAIGKFILQNVILLQQ